MEIALARRLDGQGVSSDEWQHGKSRMGSATRGRRRAWRVTAIVAMLALGATGVAAAPGGEVIETQTRLLERIREYRASLDPLLALQQAQVERAEALAARRRELFELGIISRREAEEVEQEAADARQRVEKTRARMAEAEAALSETLASIELAEEPRERSTDLVMTPGVIGAGGTTQLDAMAVSTLEQFFETRFRRPLPVSARGQTDTHDRLGLDHRHAIDVAVHPDSEEGRALIAYLRRLRIPFLAFRQAIPGAATGAHVHVGAPSHRLAKLGVPRG